jgi:hypothetical protein
MGEQSQGWAIPAQNPPSDPLTTVRHTAPPKLNNSIVTNTNDSEVDETSKNLKNDYKNDQ